MAAAEAEVPGIHADRVTDWLANHIDGVAPPFDFSLITGGHSNLTYRVQDAEGKLFVLRRPPLGAVLATAHDMAREHKIISGVGKTDVPVPPALGLCEDTEVNDAPFYVMGFVEGFVLSDSIVTQKHFEESQRWGIGESCIEVLSRLHHVDPDAIGLGDLGRKEAYLARQLKRWRGQWEKSKTRELEPMDEIYEALVQQMPEQLGATIVHGDYRLGNMLTSQAGQIVAVLDWELCTLGDPLADLGYLLNNWGEPGETGPSARGAALSPSTVPGFQTRAQVMERYSELTGRDASNVGYYRAFQYWRLAAIVEGVLARYLKGVMGAKADTNAFRAQVDGLADAALQLVRAEGL
jgi:aminoglycoside phosphotransferase (APT) family kinase protein